MDRCFDTSSTDSGGWVGIDLGPNVDPEIRRQIEDQGLRQKFSNRICEYDDKPSRLRFKLMPNQTARLVSE